MNTTLNPQPTISRSQADRMLDRLKATPGEDVPMDELARCATANGLGQGFCVARRIYDLRQRGKSQGFSIPAPKKEWREGQLHTSYRLEYVNEP